MNEILKTVILNNNIFDYSIFIGGAIILSCTIYYTIRSNYTAIPSKNMEAVTNQEIVNENGVGKINNQNIESIIENESDTDTDMDTISTYDNESLFESATSTD
jgi:hypothetical protein